MKHSKKITRLRTLSVIVTLMLGAIQFYLVSNTYNLTRETYFKEVTFQVDTFQRDSAIMRVHEAVLSGMLTLSSRYAAGEIDKSFFLKKLTETISREKRSADSTWIRFAALHPQVQDIRYAETYDWIVLGKNGYSDSLFYGKAAPICLLGLLPGQDNETWQITKTPKEAIISQDSSDTDRAGNYKVDFATSRYIGYSSGRVVFMRMLFVFVLSVILFAAMIVILFLNFKAIYQQKKIADIRSEFASNITHELQTPVSTIAIIVKTLRNGLIRSDHRLLDETISALDRQQKRLQTSVESVLESAMLEKNHIPLESVIMPDFLLTYLDDFPKSDRIFEMDLLETPIVLNTGRQVLERILRNILENAIKYSPSDTRIMIISRLTPKYYTIAIRDEGPGIAREYHQHIFEKFYRVPQQNLHSVKGLGLGLFLCTELIARLNGFITVESVRGKGATFIIHFPNI